MIGYNEIKSMLKERKLNFFYIGNAIDGTAKIVIPCSDKHYCCCISFIRDMSIDEVMVIDKMVYEEIDYDDEFDCYMQLMLNGHDNIMSGHIGRVYGEKNLAIDVNNITGEVVQ